jgi:hypothetical protein
MRRVLFDPRTLITTQAELTTLFEDYARRRVGFTAAWLSTSPIGHVLGQVRSGSTPSSWPPAIVPASATARLQAQGFSSAELPLVLAHPVTIASDPQRLVYYARLLSMSGKVFRRLFPELQRLQKGAPQPSLTQNQLDELALLNSMLVAVAERPGFGPTDPEQLVLCSEGAAIDGDWRNQVGRIAVWGAAEAMFASLSPSEIVSATATRANSPATSLVGLTPQQRSDLVDQRWKPDTIEVDTGYRVRFGPQVVDGETVDADITIARLSNGAPVVVESAGEIKGSSDPANAKERWRLAADNVQAMSRIRSGRAGRRPATFYVGLLITEAVVDGDSQVTGMRTLLDNRTLDAAFSIMKFSQAAEQQRFTDFFRAQIGK